MKAWRKVLCVAQLTAGKGDSAMVLIDCTVHRDKEGHIQASGGVGERGQVNIPAAARADELADS